MRKNNKIRIIIYTLVLLMSLGLLFTTGCSKEDKSSADESAHKEKNEITTVVQVIEPKFGYISDKLSFPGVTSPTTVTRTAFLVAGKIEGMNYQVGQAVKKGDLLATLDSEIYERQVGVASAAVGVAEANLQKVNTGARRQEIEMVKRQMLQAKSGFELAEKEKERFDRLYKIDAIPRREHDQVVTHYQVAKEQFEAAQQQLDLVKEGASSDDKHIAGSNVRVQYAQMAQASTQLKYTKLYAPITGVITEKTAEVGAVVNAGTPIYEIQSIDSIDLEVFIPSVHLEKIKMGQKAEVTFMENPGKPIEGVVREIKPMSDQMTRSYRIKIRLSSTPHLKSYTGTIGKATFMTGNKVYGAFVPLGCIVSSPDNDDNFVFLANKDNTAQKVPVKIIRMKDQKALIKGTFPENPKIILSGQEYLKDGSKVRIVNALNSQKYVSTDKIDTTGNTGSRI